MTSEQISENVAEPTFRIRVATGDDQQIVSKLFEDNRAIGEVAPDDPGTDVHNLDEHYLTAGEDGEHPSRFWVAEHAEAGVIGMVGVRGGADHRAKVRRLLVLPDYRNQGVGSGLVEQALGFCNDRGYIKVALDTQVDQKAAIALFKRFGFQLNRTKTVKGKERMEFYMDLYRARCDNSSE